MNKDQFQIAVLIERLDSRVRRLEMLCLILLNISKEQDSFFHYTNGDEQKFVEEFEKEFD